MCGRCTEVIWWVASSTISSLYDKPNLQVVTNNYVNIRDNNAGSYFTYNSQLWGQKKAGCHGSRGTSGEIPSDVRPP
jgi:hypothetical protein